MIKDNVMASLADTIIEFMPFSEEIKAFCNKNPEFKEALKVIYVERFITLGALAVSHPSIAPEDKVIGIYVYDYQIKNPIFKQDFIVDVGGTGKEFVLYTGGTPSGGQKRVKHIKEFFSKYGVNGEYKDTHWQLIDQLPTEIQERAQRAIALAEKRIAAGNPPIPQELIEQTYRKYKTLD